MQAQLEQWFRNGDRSEQQCWPDAQRCKPIGRKLQALSSGHSLKNQAQRISIKTPRRDRGPRDPTSREMVPGTACNPARSA